MADLKHIPRRTGLAVAVMAIAVLAAPGGMAAGSDDERRLSALETGVAHLSDTVDVLTAGISGFNVPGLEPVAAEEPVIRVAQSQDAAGLTVRLGQLEEQMRVLTGQIEGLQFQLTQMQTLLERMQEDNEFRFQQLEGSSLGNSGAANQSGGDVQAGGLPQTPDDTFTLDAPLTTDQPGQGNGAIDLDAGAVDLDSSVEPLGTLPGDEFGEELGAGQPLDLTFDAGTAVTDADADAQYRAGYDAAVNGDFVFAEEQFRQFVALFPDHPQAPEATAWLGETLIQRAAYDEAADVLLNGFESYPNSARAPDLLLKLGIALEGAGERETACRTFAEVQRRYPELPRNFISEINRQMANAQC